MSTACKSPQLSWCESKKKDQATAHRYLYRTRAKEASNLGQEHAIDELHTERVSNLLYDGKDFSAL